MLALVGLDLDEPRSDVLVQQHAQLVCVLHHASPPSAHNTRQTTNEIEVNLRSQAVGTHRLLFLLTGL